MPIGGGGCPSRNPPWSPRPRGERQAGRAHRRPREIIPACARNSDDLVCKRIDGEITALGVRSGADVSDIFSGVTDNHCKDGARHPDYDWNDDLIAREAFAEFLSAHFTSPESAERLKRYFPESGKIFDEMLDELGRS